MATTAGVILKTERFGAHNYHPLPVVIEQASGAWVTDIEGNRYLDFLSAYSSVNQGHCHPKIVNALIDQAKRLTLTSRAFHSNLLGDFLEKLCDYTGYEMALPMNTGAEAVETAIKMARRWGMQKKGIPNGQQEIIVCEGNFHGRTITIISASTDPDCREGFGPFTPGIKIIPYGDVNALRAAITANTCAFLVEPIQGEAGVVVPQDGFLQQVKAICKDNNVLMIADEIQTGFCRTGAKFACDLDGVKPDVMCLGKALGGGVFPVSAVVASRSIMEVFSPGSHGSTFGGNPIACAVGMAALDVMDDEGLVERAKTLGEIFRTKMSQIICDKIVEVRGKGLLNAIVFRDDFNAGALCLTLKEKGLLAKQTHGHIIRFSPPLVISQTDLEAGCAIIQEVLTQV